DIKFGQQLLLIDAVGVDEHLLDARQTRQRDLAEHVLIGGNNPPADDFKTLRRKAIPQQTTRLFRLRLVETQEHLADAVDGGKIAPETLPGHRAQEFVRTGEQQATAISGLAVRGNTAAVRHASE